jgi:hypothetical protein
MPSHFKYGQENKGDIFPSFSTTYNTVVGLKKLTFFPRKLKPFSDYPVRLSVLRIANVFCLFIVYVRYSAPWSTFFIWFFDKTRDLQSSQKENQRFRQLLLLSFST